MVTAVKSIGELFVESGACRPVVKGAAGPPIELPDFDVKTLLTTSAGFAVDTTREPAAVPFASRPLSLVDLVLATPTSSDPHKYMEETTYTNAAAEVAEGGTYPEASFAYTERSVDVSKVTTWLPITDEELEDVDGLAEHLSGRLEFAARQRLELQMLVGNGTAPNMRGILNTVGIQTQAKGADTVPVAIRKGITKVRVPGYGVPNAMLLHPSDSEEIDVAAAVDLSVPFEDDGNLWRLPRIETDALPAGTGLTGDFRNFTALKVKRGVEIQVSNQHSTFFVEGKQAIRCTFRVAFPVYRPAAFCTVTGI